MKRKNILRTACAALGMLLLAACTPSSPDGSGPNGGFGQAQGTSTQGGYAQIDITPPQLEGGSIRSVYRLADGEYQVVGWDKNDVRQIAYTTDEGQSWQLYASPSIGDIAEPPGMYYSTYAMDTNGTLWAGYGGDGGELHLLRVAPGGAQEEVALPAGLQAAGVSYFGRLQPLHGGQMLAQFNVAENIVLSVLDCETGTFGPLIRPGFYPSGIYCAEGLIWMTKSSTNEVAAFDMQSGESVKTHTMPVDVGNLDLMFTFSVAADEAFCYADSGGIHRVEAGGSMVQDVVDSVGYAYNAPSSNIAALFPQADGSYVMCVDKLQASQLLLYRYDEALQTGADQLLRIWAMEDAVPLRAALFAFSAAYPNCAVEVEYGRSGPDDTRTDEDIIRALNTALLTGSAPDVLMLDGLPAEIFIESGFLQDISDVVQDTGEYYENVLHAYKTDSGVYAYPALFTIPALFGDAADMQTAAAYTRDIQSFADFAASANMQQDNFGEVFEVMYAAYSPAIFPGGRSVDEGALRSFLQATADIVQAHGAVTEKSPESGMYEMHSTMDMLMNTVSHTYYINIPEVQYGTGYMYSMTDAALGMLLGRTTTFAPLPGAAFLPGTIGSIPQGAENPGMAKSFIRLLLDAPEVQTSSNYRGFAVHRGLEMGYMHELEARYREDEMDVMFGIVQWPSAYDWDGLIASLSGPSVTSSVLQQKVYEQAKRVYQNGQSVDEATGAVLAATQLYFSEMN